MGTHPEETARVASLLKNRMETARAENLLRNLIITIDNNGTRENPTILPYFLSIVPSAWDCSVWRMRKCGLLLPASRYFKHYEKYFNFFVKYI